MFSPVFDGNPLILRIGSDVMDTFDIAEARRALIEKYLQGNGLQPTTANNGTNKHSITTKENLRGRVVPIKAQGSRLPFFFLHGDWRGQAFYCFPLARDLEPDQPFYTIEPYTFEDLKYLPSIEEIAAIHLKSLRAVQPEGPYFLGGWCNGALIAYEVAHQLHAQGQQVSLLAMVDMMKPGRLRSIRRTVKIFCKLARLGQDKELDSFLLIRHIYRCLRYSHYRRLKASELSQANEQSEHKEAQSFFALAWLTLLFSASEGLRQDYESLVDWLNANYIPDPYTGPITFFWTDEDFLRRNRWSKSSKMGVPEVYFLPGNQITSRTEHLPAFAEQLNMCLSKAQKTKKN
jgi:thioesterase domain-containing protein